MVPHLPATVLHPQATEPHLPLMVPPLLAELLVLTSKEFNKLSKLLNLHNSQVQEDTAQVHLHLMAHHLLHLHLTAPHLVHPVLMALHSKSTFFNQL